MNPILWDAESGSVIRRFHGHTDRVICVAFLPDCRRIVSCGYDRTVRLWDVETGQEIHCFRGHRVEAVWLAVSPNGRWLLSADYLGRELWLWDVEARKPVDQLSGVAAIRLVASSPPIGVTRCGGARMGWCVCIVWRLWRIRSC